jgi:hypothetical protein
MMPDDSQHPEDGNQVIEGSTDQGGQPLYYLPFAVQLQNIFAIEIVARRFPVSLDGNSSAQLSLNLGDVQIDDENLLAQAILSVQVDFNDAQMQRDVFPSRHILMNLLRLWRHYTSSTKR